ncbi:MAG: hypothetical protein NXI30_20155 [bacterium]|nr:hypothetical protein [bacterium]
MSEGDALAREVAAEVEAFHDYLSAWFRGDVPRDDAVFDRNLSARWPTAMINIQPSGIAHPGRTILEKIRAEYGSNPDFRITIEDVRVVDVDRSEDGVRVVATYVERQRGARQSTPPENARRSSVWLLRDARGSGWRWRHLHETGMRD